MGVSDAQICYGIIFEEGFEFPWGDEAIEDWWKKVRNYNPIVEIWNKDGTRITNEQVIKEYYDHRRKWEEENPLPVDLVNYCNMDYPSYILAIPETICIANLGYPVQIDPEKLNIEVIPMNGVLANFCMKYDIEISTPPAWYLTSYQG